MSDKTTDSTCMLSVAFIYTKEDNICAILALPGYPALGWWLHPPSKYLGGIP